MSTRTRKRSEAQNKKVQLSPSATKELLASIEDIARIQQAFAVAKAHQDSLLRACMLDPGKQYRIEPTGLVTEVGPPVEA